MAAQNIKEEEYSVRYDPDATTLYFQGELSLAGPSEYAPIAQLLEETIAQSPSSSLTLNLTELEFLNSSGVGMLLKFVMSLRKRPSLQVVVLGSSSIPWQHKTLKNLEKLLPGLTLELV